MTRSIVNNHKLLDAVKERLGIEEDNEFAATLKVQPSCLSKIRNGTNKVSARVLVKIHLLTGLPIKKLLEYCPDHDFH